MVRRLKAVEKDIFVFVNEVYREENVLDIFVGEFVTCRKSMDKAY